MDYNSMFRVFDNEGDTVDRYTVFLRDNPDEGSLGLSDNPTTPQGFSQWGDFDIDIVEGRNTEIEFTDLPQEIQDHVLDRFELNELAEVEVSDVWKEIITSIMEGKMEAAKFGVKGLISNKMAELLEPTTLNEFAGGAISFKGDDVLVHGKVVGTIENDLEDYERGIVFTGLDGIEHDFESIKDFIVHIMDAFRIKESYEYLNEATSEQKYTIKAIRKLTKKLNLPQPRFSSIAGKNGLIELSSKDCITNPLPNDLRRRAAVKVLNVVPTNFDDVSHGTITPTAMTLTVKQWCKLLSCYDICVDQPVT